MLNAVNRDDSLGPPEPSALRLRAVEARHDPLSNPRALELREAPKYAEQESPSWTGRVDALPEGDEGHASGGQFFDRHHEMPEVSAEPIQSPDDDNIDPPSGRIGHQPVEFRSPVLCTRDATVHVFDCRPAASLYVSPKLLQLILGFLLSAADASIDGTAHRTMLSKAPLDSQRTSDDTEGG